MSHSSGGAADRVVVRLGTSRDLPAAEAIYREWRYRGGIQPEDGLVVADDGGMRVQPDYQRGGIGTRMLRLFVQQLDDDCFCVPYAHLLGFYGQAGFRELPRGDAPPFLAERARGYEAEGLEVAIMRRPG